MLVLHQMHISGNCYKVRLTARQTNTPIALREYGLAGQTVYVTHEVNRVTEPLLRGDAIDYLLTQDLQLMLRTAVEHLISACEARPVPAQAIIPIETYSRYSLY